MSGLPTVGGDIGAWGSELNTFLGVSLNADGTINATALAQIVSAVSAYINPPSGPAGPALNANPGFENGVLASWTATGCAAAASTLQAHTGTYSGRVVPDGVSSQGGVVTAQIPITPSTSFTATAWGWFTSAVTSTFQVNLDWYGVSQNYLSTATLNTASAPAGTWSPITGTATAPSNAYYCDMAILLTGTPAPAQVWYVDDAVLRGNATPLSRRYSSTFTGNGSTTSFAVTHGLGNPAPVYAVYNGTQEFVGEFRPTDANTGVFVFGTAPPSATYTYTMLG